MRPIPPRFVSLIGLPGSGKTTLCRSLAEALGWRAFVIGDALRERAKTDPGLQEMLDRGDLAPESIASELMRDAAHEASGKGLVIDGFPRHRDQVELARELFESWTVLYLEVPASVAASRLSQRLFCSFCNWVGTTTGDRSCPNCGGRNLRLRPEDEPEVLSKRVKQAEIRLAELRTALGEKDVVPLDATKSRGEVLQQALAALRSYWSTYQT